MAPVNPSASVRIKHPTEPDKTVIYVPKEKLLPPEHILNFDPSIHSKMYLATFGEVKSLSGEHMEIRGWNVTIHDDSLSDFLVSVFDVKYYIVDSMYSNAERRKTIIGKDTDGNEKSIIVFESEDELVYAKMKNNK